MGLLNYSNNGKWPYDESAFLLGLFILFDQKLIVRGSEYFSSTGHDAKTYPKAPQAFLQKQNKFLNVHQNFHHI